MTTSVSLSISPISAPTRRRINAISPPTAPPNFSLPPRMKTRRICCEVALNPELSMSESEEMKRKTEEVGSRVRLKSPLKVYHVPKLPELELPDGTEGLVKQYVGFWKGKRISANLPYKVEFQIQVEGRGNVKLFAHLKEDEFDFI